MTNFGRERESIWLSKMLAFLLKIALGGGAATERFVVEPLKSPLFKLLITSSIELSSLILLDVGN